MAWKPGQIISAAKVAPHRGWIRLTRRLQVNPALMEKMRKTLSANPQWERDTAWQEDRNGNRR